MFYKTDLALGMRQITSSRNVGIFPKEISEKSMGNPFGKSPGRFPFKLRKNSKKGQALEGLITVGGGGRGGSVGVWDGQRGLVRGSEEVLGEF